MIFIPKHYRAAPATVRTGNETSIHYLKPQEISSLTKTSLLSEVKDNMNSFQLQRWYGLPLSTKYLQNIFQTNTPE